MSFQLRRGAEVQPDGTGVRFSVWAPSCERLDLKLLGPPDRLIAMTRAEADTPGEEGVFTADVPDARAGMDYVFVVPGRGDRPDPTSRHQPSGPHGPSRIVDPRAFTWTDGSWRGRALADFIIYELHVGTFTPSGTFDGAIERLPHLVDLGVTAVELMPVAEFPGQRNWGYDGVNLFAPQSSYGGPEGLKRLIDACHRSDLAVVLDVVYNHLGPDGNYLADFGPTFSRRYATPWGDALNFDGADSEPVRRYFIDNARYWLTELHVDALRLDAVHGIFDQSAVHILDEMKRAVAVEAAEVGRPLSLIAESDLNDPRIVDPHATGGYALDGQWSDDFHHAAFTLLTASDPAVATGPESFAPYLADFGRMDDLRKAVADGFVYDGRFSTHRRRRHGRSSAAVPGNKLVVYLENHDQIANGARGHRLSHLVSPGAYRAAAALLFCAPYVPLLFMGQELDAATPFFYFTNHGDPVLAEAVSRGRREEFRNFAEPAAAEEWADPQAEETFRRSRIDWACLDRPAHRHALRLHGDLVALRRRTPPLRNGRKDLTRVAGDERRRWLTIARDDPAGGHALLVGNFDHTAHAIPLPDQRRHRMALFTESPAYGGTAPPPPTEIENTDTIELPPFSAAIYLSDTAVRKGRERI